MPPSSTGSPSPNTPSPLSTPNAQAWLYRAPMVVTALAIVMLGVQVFMSLASRTLVAKAFFYGGLIPARFAQFLEQGFPLDQLLIPLLTYQFLHDGWFHLMMNGLFLIAFGAPVARRFAVPDEHHLQPHKQRAAILFLLFFLSAGLVSGLAFVALHLYDPSGAVGASGSVSALMGAAIRMIPVILSQSPPQLTFQRLQPLTNRRVLIFSALIIGTNLLVAVLGNFVVPGGARIAWEAHIAGYLYGLLVSPLFFNLAKSREFNS